MTLSPVAQTVQTTIAARGGIFGLRLREHLKFTTDVQVVDAVSKYFQDPNLTQFVRQARANTLPHVIHKRNDPSLIAIYEACDELQAPRTAWQQFAYRFLTPAGEKAPVPTTPANTIYALTDPYEPLTPIVGALLLHEPQYLANLLNTGLPQQLRAEATDAREMWAAWEKLTGLPPASSLVGSAASMVAVVRYFENNREDVTSVQLGYRAGSIVVPEAPAVRTHVYSTETFHGPDKFWASREGRNGMLQFLDLRANNLDAAATFAEAQGALLQNALRCELIQTPPGQ